MNEQFGLLYAAPSFLEGIARSVDIGDTLTEYNTSENGTAADLQALRSDWLAVGNDLREAISQFERNDSKQLNHG